MAKECRKMKAGDEMGCVENIKGQNYPAQSQYVCRRVNVCFHYDTTNVYGGRIVRDDREAPYEIIIALDDGRYVLGTECQYSIANK